MGGKGPCSRAAMGGAAYAGDLAGNLAGPDFCVPLA